MNYHSWLIPLPKQLPPVCGEPQHEPCPLLDHAKLDSIMPPISEAERAKFPTLRTIVNVHFFFDLDGVTGRRLIRDKAWEEDWGFQ